jgi:hypothetical protein
VWNMLFAFSTQCLFTLLLKGCEMSWLWRC